MTPEPAPADRDRWGPWLTRLYWVALAAGFVALVLPLWVAGLAPLTDYGGHLQMVDAWSVLDSDPFYAGILEARDTWLAPNLLAARFVGLLHPLVDVDVGLRLFFTLALALQVMSLRFVIRVFQRSRWLIFLCMPFTWGGMMALGLVNYVLAIGLILFALGVARRAGETGAPRYALYLCLLGFAGFWAHGIGYVYMVAFSLGVLAISARRWWQLGFSLAYLPSFALWALWFRGTRTGAGGGTAISDVLGQETGTTLQEKIAYMVQDAMDVSQTDVDGTVFWLLIAIWVALMATSERAQLDEGDATTEGARRGLLGRGRAILRRLLAEMRAHALLLTTTAFALGIFVVPRFVGGVAIGPRLLPMLILLTMMLPRVSRNPPWIARIGLAVGVVLPIVFGAHLTLQTMRWDKAEVEPMELVAAQLPHHSRVQCVGVIGPRPFFIRRTLRHGCNGIMHHRARAYAGGGFAGTGYNAVSWRDRTWFHRVHDTRWQSWIQLHRWDYVVARGVHGRPPENLAVEVFSVPADPRRRRASWTLYKVVRSQPRPVDYLVEAGPESGNPIDWNCPTGSYLYSLSVSATEDGEAVASVTPKCRALRVTPEDLVTYRGRQFGGPRFGGESRRGQRVLSCSEGRVPVGIHGRHDRFVNRLGLICAYPDLPGTGAGDAWYEVDLGERTRAVGAGEFGPGQTFARRCPVGTVPTGIRGRAGIMLDAAGLACTRIDTVLAERIAAGLPTDDS